MKRDMDLNHLINYKFKSYYNHIHPNIKQKHFVLKCKSHHFELILKPILHKKNKNGVAVGFHSNSSLIYNDKSIKLFK